MRRKGDLSFRAVRRLVFVDFVPAPGLVVVVRLDEHLLFAVADDDVPDAAANAATIDGHHGRVGDERPCQLVASLAQLRLVPAAENDAALTVTETNWHGGRVVVVVKNRRAHFCDHSPADPDVRSDRQLVWAQHLTDGALREWCAVQSDHRLVTVLGDIGECRELAEEKGVAAPSTVLRHERKSPPRHTHRRRCYTECLLRAAV